VLWASCGEHPVNAIFKNIGVIAACYLLCAGLYASLVLLDIQWNLPRWDPYLSGFSLVNLVFIAGFVLLVLLLFRARVTRLSRVISLLPCFALAALGLYFFKAEPITSGLFARDEPSPFWYRGGRCVVLCAPVMIWSVSWLRRRKHETREIR